MSKNDIDAFFALIRAGLWEKEIQLSPYCDFDYSTIFRLADEQCVIGLVAAGLEHVVDIKPAEDDLFKFIGYTMRLEGKNMAMNHFIGALFRKMTEAGIRVALVKGQGVAQCYERPLWRTCGDVDLFLDEENYHKAKSFLIPFATTVDVEETLRLHLGMTIDLWVVELHGTMDTEFSSRVNRCIARVQKDIFDNNGVRVWSNDAVNVLLPNPDNDVFIIFTHFIDHFYVGGVGIRQISDWCRLLWTYRTLIDQSLIETRLKEMGLTEEWKSFAAFAVDYLGMPQEAMPLYKDSNKYHSKARKICRLIIESGNYGHNKNEDYRLKVGRLKSYVITFVIRLKEFARLATIFPANAPVFFVNYVFKRLRINSQTSQSDSK